MCDNVCMPSLKTTDCLVIVRTSQSREVLAVSERLEQREQARKTPGYDLIPRPAKPPWRQAWKLRRTISGQTRSGDDGILSSAWHRSISDYTLMLRSEVATDSSRMHLTFSEARTHGASMQCLRCAVNHLNSYWCAVVHF
jgi:hypothetical protein